LTTVFDLLPFDSRPCRLSDLPTTERCACLEHPVEHVLETLHELYAHNFHSIYAAFRQDHHVLSSVDQLSSQDQA